MGERDYSSTPLWKKLGIKPGARFAIVGSPDDFTLTVPDGADEVRSPAKEINVILVFETRGEALRKTVRALRPKLAPDGGLWLAYPKKTSGIETDLTFEAVQRTGLDAGLVDNKSCAIDGSWSGVRFVYRIEDRPR